MATRIHVSTAALLAFISSLFFVASPLWGTPSKLLANQKYSIEPCTDGSLRITAGHAGTWTFRGDFSVIVANSDPQPAMRPGGIPRVTHNVVSWRQTGVATSTGAGTTLKAGRRSKAQAGDGFDDRILNGDTKQRTADVFAIAPMIRLSATTAVLKGRQILLTFPEQEAFTLAATVELPEGDTEPVLSFVLTPRLAAWYSVGYVGAPAFAPEDTDEFWQPFIWTEKRFPPQSFLTPAFECSLPAAFVRKDGVSLGVVADADEFPFSPLPSLENSRFGMALRNMSGKAQPMLFAPLPGGPGSHREAGESFAFKLRLVVLQGDVTNACEHVARGLYGFSDYRRNAIASINETLDNMIDYGMSSFSWFVEDLKGCAYSTDVPGAVKNVSSLNPFSIALVTDDGEIFRKRAYPIIEYVLSREKFLFSLDPKQKIQSPSRALKGPCAPVSELAALYGITHGASPFLRKMAVSMLSRNRTLNLDDVSEGGTWENQLAVWSETGDARFLDAARRGADKYVTERVDSPASEFGRSQFFWNAFTPAWIDLFRLFEATGERRYLEAARLGARRYAMFTWMSPRIPAGDITVNPGGKAPVYWYLKSKGHLPMEAPEERVPAWRLSEIGLTPESSGTMSGHRGIFMANYAPWMLRISALTGDAFLHDVARSAVVGRYRNFPGYHINTERTTIYERADYPLRSHKELSVNSFHYNHIWPHMSILLDFLVSDIFARSGGRIDFPSHFVEGYAYLQSKFYGDRAGRFFERNDAVLWMPRRLLRTGSVEINTLVARGRDRLYLAFANQSPEMVTTELVLNPSVLPSITGKSYSVNIIAGKAGSELKDGRLSITVAPMGLTAVEVEGLVVVPKFQDHAVRTGAAEAWRTDYLELPWGGTRAMILNFGKESTSAYLYLQADDSQFKQVSLAYSTGDNSEETTLTDSTYPFEFTIPLSSTTTAFRFKIKGLRQSDGAAVESPSAELRK